MQVKQVTSDLFLDKRNPTANQTATWSCRPNGDYALYFNLLKRQLEPKLGNYTVTVLLHCLRLT